MGEGGKNDPLLFFLDLRLCANIRLKITSHIFWGAYAF